MKKNLFFSILFLLFLVLLNAQNQPCTPDPLFSHQWGLHNTGSYIAPPLNYPSYFKVGFDISACEAWEYSEGEGIKIAIISCTKFRDFPYLPSDIAGNIPFIDNTYGGYNADEDEMRKLGVIAAQRNNTEFVGVAPKCKLYPIYIDRSYLIPEAIDAALNLEVDIILIFSSINMLPYLQGNAPSKIAEIEEKIQFAQTNGRDGKGCVVICPSGDGMEEITNHWPETFVRFPASTNPSIITVGGINPFGKRVTVQTKYDISGASYTFTNNHSCYGTGLDVVAPGDYIFSTVSVGTILNMYLQDYGRGHSTEFAAAYVAGIAALVLGVNPDLTYLDVRKIILSSCKTWENDCKWYEEHGELLKWDEDCQCLVECESEYEYDEYLFYDTIPISERGGVEGVDPVEKGWNIEVGYGLVNAHNAVLAAIPCYSGLPVVKGKITQNTTWDTPVHLIETITVPSGVTLTITNTVKCNSDVSIIVNFNGKLVINGGTLTNACEGEMWQGITVYGGAPPTPPNVPGLAHIYNGGIIENAVCGIKVLDGGQVNANFATFLNNQTGVWFKPVFSGQNATLGSFTNTFFKLNNNFMGNNTGDFNAHLIMDSCAKVSVSGCVFSKTTLQQSNGVVVTNTTTNWTNDNSLLSVPLTLHSGAILNNTGNIYSNINTNIEVYPNAKLIIDGGSLSSDLERPRGMWQGVTLYGGSSSNNTEMIQLINGGIIENALCGITVNDYATVTANNAHFLNNTMGVKFNPVQNNSTFTSGTFNNTNFELNNRYLGNDPFDVHLFMENSGSVNINNSIFSSTANKKTTTKNKGIVAQNSGLIISDIYGPGAGTNSQFTGFNTAISATTKGGAPVFKVYDGIFDNNLYGIEVDRINNIEIINNEFYISDKESIGVSIAHSTGYKIEANYFTGTGSDSQLTFGLHISDSGTDNNKVYLNTFYGLSIGQLFTGLNADKDTGIGLQSLCNSFRGNSGRIHDIYIGKYPVNNPGDVHLIATDQGNADVPAGNTFDATNSFIINISNNSAPATMINYYHGPGNLEFPSFNNNVNPILVPESAKCGSKSREEEDEVSGMRYEVRGMRYEVSGEDEVSGVRDEVSGENLRESVSSVSSACKENDIILIPNPTTGVLQVTSYELQVTGIEVFDIYGKNLTPHTSYLAPQTSLDISNLASGVYFVKIYTNAGVVTKKVIKN